MKRFTSVCSGFLFIWLHGCLVSLRIPEDALVSCTTSADCKEPLGQCLAGYCRKLGETLDESAPSLLSVDATSPLTLRAIFSEALSQNLQQELTARVSGLEIEGISQSADGQTLTFTTTAQTPGGSYSLRITGLRDQAGNEASEIITSFFGFGTIDRTPPELLAPAADETVAKLSALLVFSGRTGAPGYEVQIATDPAMTAPIASGPFFTTAIETTLLVAFPHPGRFYWTARVLAEGALPTAPRAIGVLDDVIYVGCTTSQCGVGAASAPMPSLGAALDLARTLGIQDVRVASNLTSTLPIFLDRRLSLRGGYDATFTTQNVATGSAVSTSGTCFTITANDVLVEGFHCVSTAVVPAITLSDAERVTVRDVSVLGSPASTNVGLLVVESDDVLFTRLNVSFCRAEVPDGNCQDPSVISVTGQITAARVIKSSVIFDDCSLIAGGNIAGTGLEVGQSGFVTVRSSVVSGGAPYYDLDTLAPNESSTGYGVLIDTGPIAGGGVTITDSRIHSGNRYKHECAGIEHRRGTLTAERNNIVGCKREGAGAAFAAGITRGVNLRPRRVQDLPSATLVNNVIVAGQNSYGVGAGDWETVGIDVGSSSQQVRIIHNLVQASTGTKIGAVRVGNKQSPANGVELLHNVFAVTGSSENGLTPTQSGVVLTLANEPADLLTVAGNLSLDLMQHTSCLRIGGSNMCPSFAPSQLQPVMQTLADLTVAPNAVAQPMLNVASADFSWKTGPLAVDVDVLTRLLSAMKDIRNMADRPATLVSYGPYQR